MKNKLLDLSNFETSTLQIKNYNSIDLTEVREYLNSIDNEWFVQLKITEGSKIEKIINDYYGSTDYYDLILFLNKRDMLFDMPYSYDVIIDAIETDLEEYKYKVFGNTTESFSSNVQDRLQKYLDTQYTENNNKFSYIKVPKRAYIYKIVRKINEILETQKDMYTLLDEEL